MSDLTQVRSGPQPYCVFKAGDMTFGVEASRVMEVVRGGRVTPAPLAPREVMGLMNLRGQVLTVLGLAHRLGFKPELPPRPILLIIKTPGDPVSLWVEELGDVVELEEAGLQEPPANLPGEVKRLIRGAFPLGGSWMLALRLEAALEVEIN